MNDPTGLFGGVAGVGVGMAMASSIRMAATTVYTSIYEGATLALKGLEAYVKDGMAGVTKVFMDYAWNILLTLGVGFAVLKGIPIIGSFFNSVYDSVRKRVGSTVRSNTVSRLPSAVTSLTNADLFGHAARQNIDACFVEGTQVLYDDPICTLLMENVNNIVNDLDESIIESNNNNNELFSNEIILASVVSIAICAWQFKVARNSKRDKKIKIDSPDLSVNNN
jgi:hypothetical protein